MDGALRRLNAVSPSILVDRQGAVCGSVPPNCWHTDSAFIISLDLDTIVDLGFNNSSWPSLYKTLIAYYAG